MQPRIELHYSPVKSGCVSALFYIESGADVYGWHAKARRHRFQAAFFMIENFYAERASALYRSIEDDVYGLWISDLPPSDHIVRCPLPEPVRHELERIQSQFLQEWLFFENDPDSDPELAAYLEMRLPVHAFNIKSRKLKRMEKKGMDWLHQSAGINPNVADFIEKFWRHSEQEIAR